ncbi:hypothetical protein F5051DRAFT_443301 [Lentinula edodes]|nr:hypothetical protein F5051DRAFT_443301 [Lentinula edodes]
MPTCVATCQKSFSSLNSLQQHQRICKHYASDFEAVVAARVSKRSSEGSIDGQTSKTLGAVKKCKVPLKKTDAAEFEPAPQSLVSEKISSTVPPLLSPSPPPAPLPLLNRAGQPMRSAAIPAPPCDVLPQAPPAVLDHMVVMESNEPTHRIRHVFLIVRDTLKTHLNPFRLFRLYKDRPSYDPDAFVSLDDLSKQTRTSIPLQPQPSSSSSGSKFNPVWPFNNMSTYQIMQWLNTGSSLKSEGETTQLVEEVLMAPDFNVEDLEGFKAHRENLRADKAKLPESSNYLAGFETASVDIRVPSVIREAFSGPLSDKIHFSPFKLFHQSPLSNEEICVHGELYTSDSFIQAHDKIQRVPLPPDESDCKLERAVAAVMLWSDATYVANFGTAQMWPIYLMLGNISKYVRALPDSGACHHLAYIPSDFAMRFHSKWKTQKASILTHCRRELMHSVWRFLLTDEFIHAYRYGIVIECGDGIKRRIYPRFFTYSADYPEKVLLATIRDKGLCPCPRCLIRKDSFDRMGLVRDMQMRTRNIRTYFVNKVNRARHFIYSMGHPINGVHVENLLKDSSSVPTENAFMEHLGIADFELSKLLVVDFLHEFELGVWKTLFKHLVRLLYSLSDGTEKVTELDSRFRCISTFGVSTIRRFANNASEMKKLAARDFEDLLQCTIPAFEGLLPDEHNARLMKLLYRLGEWHALAKLRMHTDLTLRDLSSCTTVVGTLMREFRDKTCSQFDMLNGIQQLLLGPFHAMADYVPTIRWFGTIDSYSTQLGELAHRLVKRLYGLTNKRQHEDQIARRYNRSKMLANARFAKKKADMKGKTRAIPSNVAYDMAHAHQVGFGEGTGPEDLDIPLDVHHFMSNRRNHPVYLTPFLLQQHSDPAKKNFVSKLEDHLLGRLKEIPFDGDYEFTADERQDVIIAEEKIYAAKTLRINYTTYNVHRDQDVINPRTDHNTIMLKSPDTNPDAHPYWYAQVLGIFHADIIHCDSKLGLVKSRKQMEFLWVRWLGTEPDYRPGQKIAKLPKVGFVPKDDEFAFGFLNPSQVIRACHLIPAFVHGKSNDLLATRLPTAARKVGESEDWLNYYVMIFVDRDMFMRYHGGAIGHIDIRQCWDTDSIPEGDEDNDTSDVDFTGPKDILTPNFDSEESDLAA